MNYNRYSDNVRKVTWKEKATTPAGMAAIAVTLVVAVIFWMVSIQRVAVGLGEEYVLVDQPYLFGSGGVRKEPVTVGSQLVWASAKPYKYVIRPKVYDAKIRRLPTKDGTPVNIYFQFTLQIVPGTSVDLHKALGPSWVERIIMPGLTSTTRDAIRLEETNKLMTDAEAVARINQAVSTFITDQIKAYQLQVTVVSVDMQAIMPPEEVDEEIGRTAAQAQRILTQTKRAAAEEARSDAEEKKAIADRKYMEKMNMTPNEYIRMREVENRTETIEMIRNKNNVSVSMNMGVAPVATLPLK